MLPRPPSRPASQPLRVLHVASGDLWAGAEAQVFEQLKALHNFPGITVRAAIMNPGILADRLAAEGLVVDVFDERRESSAKLGHRLWRIAADWRPAVVHTHRRKEHILGGLAALACGATAIATIHGRREFSHQWWKLNQSLISALEVMALRRIHRRLISVSSDLARHLPYPAGRIVVIPNSIEVEAVRTAAAAAAPELPDATSTRLAFLGRLVPVKRVDRIIEALAALRAIEPDRWSLFIIGEGPLKPELEAQVAAAGLETSVHFLGFKPNPMPWVAEMDALVFASEHEGLPMTALEALALGVPVISPAIGGLPDLIQEAGLGTVASSSDPDAIAAAVRSTVVSSPLPRRERNSALPRRYTGQQSAEDHMRVYREVAG